MIDSTHQISGGRHLRRFPCLYSSLSSGSLPNPSLPFILSLISPLSLSLFLFFLPRSFCRSKPSPQLTASQFARVPCSGPGSRPYARTAGADRSMNSNDLSAIERIICVCLVNADWKASLSIRTAQAWTRRPGGRMRGATRQLAETPKTPGLRSREGADPVGTMEDRQGLLEGLGNCDLTGARFLDRGSVMSFQLFSMAPPDRHLKSFKFKVRNPPPHSAYLLPETAGLAVADLAGDRWPDKTTEDGSHLVAIPDAPPQSLTRPRSRSLLRNSFSVAAFRQGFFFP